VNIVFTGVGLGQALEKSTGIGWRPQQLGSLVKCIKISARHQDRVSSLRRDLDWFAVFVHLLNERKKVLSSFACGNGHVVFLLARVVPLIVPDLAPVIG
jgi:hypothetical protein